MCLVFYSDDEHSRRTITSAMKEEREEKIVGVDLSFADPHFKDQLIQALQYWENNAGIVNRSCTSVMS
jgi:hypothetical protein